MWQNVEHIFSIVSEANNIEYMATVSGFDGSTSIHILATVSGTDKQRHADRWIGSIYTVGKAAASASGAPPCSHPCIARPKQVQRAVGMRVCARSEALN